MSVPIVLRNDVSVADPLCLQTIRWMHAIAYLIYQSDLLSEPLNIQRLEVVSVKLDWSFIGVVKSFDKLQLTHIPWLSEILRNLASYSTHDKTRLTCTTVDLPHPLRRARKATIRGWPPVWYSITQCFSYIPWSYQSNSGSRLNIQGKVFKNSCFPSSRVGKWDVLELDISNDIWRLQPRFRWRINDVGWKRRIRTSTNRASFFSTAWWQVAFVYPGAAALNVSIHRPDSWVACHSSASNCFYCDRYLYYKREKTTE